MEAETHTVADDVEQTGRGFSWRTLGVLVAAAAFTSLLLIPFSTTL